MTTDEHRQEEPRTDRWRYLDHPSAVGFSHLGTWSMAAAQQAERVLDGRREMALRQVDGYQFILDLRQVLRAADMIVKGLIEEQKAEHAEVARAAREAFEAAVPDAKDARDVLDHFDDYARGIGNLSHPGVPPKRRTATEEAARSFNVFYETSGDGHFVLHLGALAINVADAHRAVERLLADMYTALGLGEADIHEAMASFEPYVDTNPAFVGLAFFTLINDDLTEEALGNLRRFVTPESVPQWRDFKEVKAMLAKYSIASKVHFVDDDTAYMKLMPEVDRPRQVRNDGFPIIDAQFITLQRRPELDGAWRVHAAGARHLEPDEMPELL